MVLVLLSFPFLLRQIVQSLPEGTRKTGWLVKLCFQIVGVPNCVSQIVCFSKLWVFQIVFHQTDAMQNTNKGNEKSERERTKKNKKECKKKIGSIQNKSNCNDQ